MDIFVIMFGDILFESKYYTDENTVSKRVESLIDLVGKDFWYQKLSLN